MREDGEQGANSYEIYSDQIDNPSLRDDLRRNFRDDRSAGGGDWGGWRVRIYPLPGTERFGRTGFYLHGGYWDGSAGCIDFAGGIFGNNKLLRDCSLIQTALGNIESKLALPVLTKLVHTKSEPDYIRCDALAAIAMIDQQNGLRVASEVNGEGPECLSDAAEHLQRDYAGWVASNGLRRTYFQALLGRHS